MVPRELLFPLGVNDKESKQRSAVDFDTAESNAVAAAANNLHIPLNAQVVVASVVDGGPADGSSSPTMSSPASTG